MSSVDGSRVTVFESYGKQMGKKTLPDFPLCMLVHCDDTSGTDWSHFILDDINFHTLLPREFPGSWRPWCAGVTQLRDNNAAVVIFICCTVALQWRRLFR